MISIILLGCFAQAGIEETTQTTEKSTVLSSCKAPSVLPPLAGVRLPAHLEPEQQQILVAMKEYLPPGQTLGILVSEVRFHQGPVEIRRTEKLLEVSVPSCSPRQDWSRALDLVFVSELKAEIERSRNVRISKGINTTLCDGFSEDHWKRPSQESLIDGLRGINQALDFFPGGADSWYRPRVALVEGLRSADGEYWGQEGDGCIVISSEIGEENIAITYVHEFGHLLHERGFFAGWPEGGYTETWNYHHNAKNKPRKPGFVSDYARKNLEEDIAETVEILLTDCQQAVSLKNEPKTRRKMVIAAKNIGKLLYSDPDARDAVMSRFWKQRCHEDPTAWSSYAK